MGDINVYSGPMKCGKTQQILNEYKRQLIAGKKVKMFKPTIDTRTANNVVASRNGIDIPAIPISKISDLEKYEADVYCIDEFQFLKGNVKIIENMAECGKKFFIAGLNLTAEKKPFGKVALPIPSYNKRTSTPSFAFWVNSFTNCTPSLSARQI